MKMAVVGAGVVGLTTGAGLAELGHRVICVDIDAGKVEALKRGAVPYHEPELQELVSRNTAAGRLGFGTALFDVPADTDLIFIAVGTPSDERGDLSLDGLWSAFEDIAAWLKKGQVEGSGRPLLVAIKSTVPVGTAERAEREMRGRIPEGRRVKVASVPEFMREGSAVRDFLEPARIVIGTRSEEAAARLRSVHEGLPGQVILTDRRSAELAKLSSNAFLAVKISFANEIAALCERTGADYADVARVLGSDPRIGPHFLGAGLGFGGSCLPKDTRALVRTAEQRGEPLTLVDAAIRVNLRQPQRLVNKLKEVLDESYRAHGGGPLRLALLGLAFKGGTNDMREAPSLRLVEELLAHFPQLELRAYDPAAGGMARPLLPASVIVCDSAKEALMRADGAIVATDWPEFRHLRADDFQEWMNHPIIWDGRNVLDAALLRSQGITYFGAGRMPAECASWDRQPERPVPQSQEDGYP